MKRWVRNGSVPPLCEKIQRMSGYFCDMPLNTRCAMVRVDHRLAAVELGIDRREGCVAEIFSVVAGQQADAVGLEGVEGVFDFPEAAVGIERRNRREQAEAARVIAHELGAILVDLAAQLARPVRVA